MTSYFVIRHGHTGVTRDQRTQFGPEGPPLSKQGEQEAKELRTKFQKMGLDTIVEAVAVSEYLRTRQTAELAGYQDIHANPLLNEIFTGLPSDELKAMIEQRQLPEIVIKKAQALLDSPPAEKIWITHGLVIMGLRQLLDLAAEPFDPPHCSIVQITI